MSATAPLRVLLVGLPRREVHAALPVRPERVVLGPLLWIAQDLVGLVDLLEAALRRFVALVGVGMVLLHQRLVLRLHRLERRIRAEPHHLQRLALGVADRIVEIVSADRITGSAL